MTNQKKNEIVKAAIAWAEQRKRCRKVQSLGTARARAALYDKAEKLQTLALEGEREKD